MNFNNDIIYISSGDETESNDTILLKKVNENLGQKPVLSNIAYEKENSNEDKIEMKNKSGDEYEKEYNIENEDKHKMKNKSESEKENKKDNESQNNSESVYENNDENEKLNGNENENENKNENKDENKNENINENNDIIYIDDEQENTNDDVISIIGDSEYSEDFFLDSKKSSESENNYTFHGFNNNLKYYSNKYTSSHFLNDYSDSIKSNKMRNKKKILCNINNNNNVRYANINTNKMKVCLKSSLLKSRSNYDSIRDRYNLNSGIKDTCYKYPYIGKNKNLKKLRNIMNSYNKRNKEDYLNFYNKGNESITNNNNNYNDDFIPLEKIDLINRNEETKHLLMSNGCNNVLNELNPDFCKDDASQKEIISIDMNNNKKELLKSDIQKENNNSPIQNETKEKNKKKKKKVKKRMAKTLWEDKKKANNAWIFQKKLREKNISINNHKYLKKKKDINRGLYISFMSKKGNLVEILFKNKFVEMSFINEKEENVVNKYCLDFELLSLNNKDFLNENVLKNVLSNRKETYLNNLINHTIFSQSLSSAVIVDFENIRIGFKNRYGRNMEINDFFEIINNIIYLLNFKCNVVHIHATHCEEFLRCKHSQEDYTYYKEFFLKLEKIKEEAEKWDLELKIYYYITKAHYVYSNSIKQLGTDIEIGLDIQEMGYKNYVDCVILLSSDSDFFNISYKSLNCQFIHCSDRRKTFFDIDDKLSPFHFIMKFGKPIIICCFKNDLTKSKYVKNGIIKTSSFNYLSLVYKTLCSKCERYAMMKLYENIENEKHTLIEKINNIKRRENNEVKESVDILLLDDFISYVNPLFLNGEKFNYSYFLSNQYCSCAYSLKEVERKINIPLS